MINNYHILLTFFAVVILTQVNTDALAVNKCIDKSGKVTYQDRRCSDDTKQSVLKLPAQHSADTISGPSNRFGPAANDDSEDAKILELVSVQTGYEGCLRASPDFEELYGDVYTAWREQNAENLTRLERSGRYQLILENGRKQIRAQPMDIPGIREKLTVFCKYQFIQALKNEVR